jgi:hypothetical protein
MATVSRIGFYDVRDWIQSQEDFQEVFGGDLFFYPISEPSETSPPHAIYEIRRAVDPNEWWMTNELVYMKIISFEVDQIFHALNIISDMAAKGSESADELNKWIVSEKRRKDFEFHSIELFSSRDRQPPKERGGAYEYEIGLSISYSFLSGRSIKSD